MVSSDQSPAADGVSAEDGPLIWQVLDIVWRLEALPGPPAQITPLPEPEAAIQRLRLKTENTERRLRDAVEREREQRVQEARDRHLARPMDPPDGKPAQLVRRLRDACDARRINRVVVNYGRGLPLRTPPSGQAHSRPAPSPEGYRQVPAFGQSANAQYEDFLLASETADQSLQRLELEYAAQLRSATIDAERILHHLERWKHRSWLARLFALDPPPPALPATLVQQLNRLQDLAIDLARRHHDAGPFPSPTCADLDERLCQEKQELWEGFRAQSTELNREYADRIQEQADLNREQQREYKLEHRRLVGELSQELHLINGSLRVPARAWAASIWASAAPPKSAGGEVRLGTFPIDQPATARSWEAPATLSFPFDTGLLFNGAGDAHEAATELARSVCTRLLAVVPAGKLNFIFIDPVGLGRSAADFQHLADYDKNLVGIKPATTAREIEERLAGLCAHLEMVISEYLRGQFASIDDYNAVAGELAEPYRVLVVFGYPAGFSEQAAQDLLRLAVNGPECGVHVIMVGDPEREQPRDLPFDRLWQTMHTVDWRDISAGRACLQLIAEDGYYSRDIVPDAAPPIVFKPDGTPASAAARLMTRVGEGARAASDRSVTLARLLPVLNDAITTGRSTGLPSVIPPVTIDAAEPSTWWRGSTASNAIAPLGLAGARDVAAMFFSSTEIAGGAIMVGLPRSGKTTSLHSAILTMCMLYGPDELELYLIDAKHGVEFKVYETLPHARMVSVNSEREFSVAVLKSLDSEVKRRAELMKSRAAGRANLTEYREVTGDQLTRIVLIVDEFHELFEEDDQLGQEAFRAFSNIVRQGPFAGVHVVVASQTLAAMPAMDRPTLQLLPQRVAFMCNESDADLVMGDANHGTRLLTKQGKGLFNPVRGEISHNKPFQGLFIHPDKRGRLIQDLHLRAGSTGWHRDPRVFDGDSTVPRPTQVSPDASPSRIRIPIGEPFTLAPFTALTLRRSRGANILLLGDTDDDERTPDTAVRGALHSVISAARSAGAEVVVADFIADEQAGGGLTIADLAQSSGAEYLRSREVGKALRQLAAVVDGRLADRNFSAPGQVLVLFGLQRALSLQPVPAYRLDEREADGPEDADGSMSLAVLLRDGPETGVHVIAACDSLRAAERRLGPDALGEFWHRVAGSAATPADLAFTAGAWGDVPSLRHHQLLIGDQFTGKTTRVRGYPLLTEADVSRRQEAGR